MGPSRQELESRTSLDEVFVFRLKALHSILAPLMYDSLKDRLATDKAFKQKYEEWVKKQGWALNEERHRNVADQAAYILINKILFYKALERKKNLPPLTKKDNVTELLVKLRECFEAALKVDYRAVFQRDPIYDEIPLTPEAAQRLNILIDEVSEYDISKMKRDVIGTLYEKLIPRDERRTLGQFYTPPQIVGLIVWMCARNSDDKVLDPGCGSGGFLVASYDRLLELREREKQMRRPIEELVLLDEKTGEERFRIEREFWMHKQNGEWVPNYIIKSPRECESIIVNPKDLRYRVLMIHKWKTELEGINVLKYIQWGEEQGFHERPTCSSRRRWYELGKQNIPDYLLSLIIGDRLFAAKDEQIYVDHNLVCIHVKSVDHQIKDVVGAFLISTLFGLFREINGISSLGLGALKADPTYTKPTLIPNPFKLTNVQRKLIKSAFDEISRRPIGSIFEEIGADKPENVSLGKVKSDRKALDDVIFDILELSQGERLDAYKAIIDLVQRRATKAEEVEVLVGLEIGREKPWPLSPKELEELITLLQLSKVEGLTEEQESALSHRAGKVARDLTYEIIRLRHEPMTVKETAQRVLDIEDDVLMLAGYYEVISEVMGGKATAKQVVRDLIGMWRDQPEGIEKTISRLLSGDGRFLQIEQGLFGLREWSPNELFQIYVQLVSKYRTANYEKKEAFRSEAIRLLQSGEVDFPDKEGLIQTLRRI